MTLPSLGQPNGVHKTNSPSNSAAPGPLSPFQLSSPPSPPSNLSLSLSVLLVSFEFKSSLPPSLNFCRRTPLPSQPNRSKANLKKVLHQSSTFHQFFHKPFHQFTLNLVRNPRMRKKVLVTKKRSAPRRRKLILDDNEVTPAPAVEKKGEERAVEENIGEGQGTAEVAVVETSVGVGEGQGTAEAAVVKTSVGVGEGQATAVEETVVERSVGVAEGEETAVESTVEENVRGGEVTAVEAAVEEEGLVGSEDENSEEGDESEEDENEVGEDEDGNEEGDGTESEGDDEEEEELQQQEVRGEISQSMQQVIFKVINLLNVLKLGNFK